MHEIEITTHILKETLELAKNRPVQKIKAINLALGPFCGFVPECIQMYMDVISQGTIAQNVKINARMIPVTHARKKPRSTGFTLNVLFVTAPISRDYPGMNV